MSAGGFTLLSEQSSSCAFKYGNSSTPETQLDLYFKAKGDKPTEEKMRMMFGHGVRILQLKNCSGDPDREVAWDIFISVRHFNDDCMGAIVERLETAIRAFFLPVPYSYHIWF